MNSAIKQYREAIKAEGQVATPHHLVQMLMQNVLERLASAKGSMSRNEIAPANENIVKAMSVIAALRSSLDMDNGGEISANLNLLYGYMGTKLLEAVQKQDVTILDEVAQLMKPVLEAWEAMPMEVKEATDLSQFAPSR